MLQPLLLCPQDKKACLLDMAGEPRALLLWSMPLVAS